MPTSYARAESAGSVPWASNPPGPVAPWDNQTMLKELRATQVSGELRRRWFADEHFDLIVWFAEDDTVDGFQLCYNLGHAEHALTWDRSSGYRHDRVDDGESSPTRNRTPILVADAHFPASQILSRMESSCDSVDAPIRTVVVEKIRAYAEGHLRGAPRR